MFRKAVICDKLSKSNSCGNKHLQYEDLISQILKIATTPKTTKITILELMRK